MRSWDGWTGGGSAGAMLGGLTSFGNCGIGQGPDESRRVAILAHAEVGPSPTTRLKILVIDDEDAIGRTVCDGLAEVGHQVVLATDGRQAMSRLDQETFDLVITDIRLPGVDGLTIFRRLRREVPTTHVILMSAYGTVAEAVSAMQDKAAHYLAKPFDIDELLATVGEIAERHHVRRLLGRAREALDDPAAKSPLVGNSAEMRALKQRIAALEGSEITVLITGESGVGKEIVAQTIHDQSTRRSGPMVAVNCAAFPETLLEAELFGYERGAFTGAFRRRDGRFRAAQAGTLFLDEIGEMTPAAQAKLLRVFEEGVYQPLGTNANVKADVRVIAATNVELAERIKMGGFREDLYYRLKVFTFEIPPLRRRREDIPLLVEHCLRTLQPVGQETKGISPSAWAALTQYEYPGNVRELKHAIQHALVLCRTDEIDLEHLPSEFRREDGSDSEMGEIARPLHRALGAFERQYLIRVLGQVGWSKTKAAEVLQISRKNLWEKLRRHSIIAPDSNGDSGD